MAECQNFFDNVSPSSCRSSSSTDQLLPATRSDCADHGLELHLGPYVDDNKPKQHEMVRPIPLYPSLDTKKRSGDFVHRIEKSPLFRGHSDVSIAYKSLFSKDSAFTTPSGISREQVWHTLQKTDVVLGHDVCTSKAKCEDVASSMWDRRSTSMQILMPSSEMGEVDVRPIQRSCSIGVPISCESSVSQEALVDESSNPTNLLLYNPQHEVQKRREMQARRRLEARKRRRLLLEVKQQKKSGQSIGLNIRHCASLAHMQSMDHNWDLQPHPKTSREVLCAKRGGDDVRLNGRYNKNNAHTKDMSPVERGKLNKSLEENDGNGLEKIEKMMVHKECESNSNFCSKHIKGDLTDAGASRNLSLPAMNDSNQGGKDANIVKGVKSTPSNCSEIESAENKGDNPMDSFEHELSSPKGHTDNHLDCIGVANVPHSNMPTSYPLTLLRAMSGVPTSQENFVFPASSKKDSLHMWHLTPSACKPINKTVRSSFGIKKTVGVFSEGKWKTSDEKSAFLPIRRTISNILEVTTNPQCSTKICASKAPSQLKFATMGIDNVANAHHKSMSNVLCKNFFSASKMYLHSVGVKKECLFDNEEEKPIVGLKGVELTQDMPSDICKAKVKEEEDTRSFDGHLVSKHQELDAINIDGGVLNTERSASLLNLPLVTTTGRGPNGKTITGVMYISSACTVRLVCRCHGRHMSPGEFVEHSGSTDLSNPLRNIVVNPSPLFNQVAFAPV